MEGDQSKPLLAASPTSFSRSRNGDSASDELSGDQTRGNPPRVAPPTKERRSSSYSTTPPPAAAAGTPVPSSSPSPPPAAAAGTPVPSSSPSPLFAAAADTPVPSSSLWPLLAAAAGTPVPSSSPSPRTAAGVPEDRPAFYKIPSRPLPVGASSNGNANANKEGSGVSKNSPPGPTPTLPSLSLPNGQGRVFVGNGASLSGGVCWDLSGKMRRLPSLLPVFAPPGLRETLRRQGARAVCRLTARLGILGLTLLVILHLVWMLPGGTFANVFIYAFGVAAIILHILSWAMSGEETVEEITAPASEQK